MKLFKIEIPKPKLSLIPENERIFFIQLTNMLNDLNILQKLIYFSSKGADDEIVRAGQNSQALFLIKMQAGKLFEGWRLIQDNFFGTKLSKNYEKDLSDLGRNSLTKLKRYFGRTNLISLIRNEFAFHYSLNASSKIKRLIDDIRDSEVFEIFLSENHGNCLYYISHVLVNTAILRSIDSSDFAGALDKLLKDINQVTRWFLDFLGDCVKIIIEKYLGLEQKEIEIPEPPNIDEVALPYFVKKGDGK